MTINCDIGERGSNHPVDVALMDYINVANIACGGHAGDKDSVDFYLSLANEKCVKVTAHLSYQDKENFGRLSMDIPFEKLKDSLDQQYSLITEVKTVKFHGALYNDANINRELSEFLTKWLSTNGIKEIVTPNDSVLAECCRLADIKICSEAFAERRYIYNKETKQLLLVPRSKTYASIKNCFEAVKQSKSIILDTKVDVYSEDESGNITSVKQQIIAETICIHSDSVIALQLAKELMECDKK